MKDITRRYRYKDTCLAAALTGVIYLGLFIALGYVPFGSNSFARGDGYIQYCDFFMYYKDVLAGENSIAYTFTKMLGGSNYTLFSYYLASPLNLLIMLFKKTDVLLFFQLIFTLKAMLAAAFCHIFLTRRFAPDSGSADSKNRRDSRIYPVLLSVHYGMSQYIVSQSCNVMWLDGVYMLPLILLGVYRVVHGDRLWKLALPVAFSILFNWYTAGMNCLFAIFWAVLEYLLSLTAAETEKSWHGFASSALRFIIAMALGVLCSAVLFLPTVLTVSGTDKGHLFWEELFDFSFRGSISSIIEHSVYGGRSTSEQVSLFCGALPIVGALTALFGKNKKTQGVILWGGLLFVLLMFVFNPLYALFNLLEKPTSHYCRFSYLQCFYLIFLAAWGLTRKRDQKPSGIVQIAACAVYVLFLIGINILRAQEPKLQVFLTGTAVLTGLIVVLVHQRGGAGKTYRMCCAVLLILFCVLDCGYHGKSLMDHYHRSDGEKTVNYIARQERAIRSIQENDSGVYRISQTNNKKKSKKYNTANYDEPMGYNYWSITEYSSTAKDWEIAFMEKSGYRSEAATMNIVNTSLLGVDSLLGVKYILSDYQINGLEKQNTLPAVDDKEVYYNPFSLPMAFLYSVDEKMMEAGSNPFTQKVHSVNPFEYQNIWFSYLANENNELYVPLRYERSEDYFYRIYIPEGRYAVYGNLPWGYTSSETPILNVNGKMKINYNCWLSPSVFYIPTEIGAREATVKANGDMDLYEGEEQFYALDLNKLQEVTDKIRKEAGHIDYQLQNGRIHIETEPVEKGKALFLSVPADEGWSIQMNGKDIQPEIIGDIFYYFPLSPGVNQIEMNYHIPHLGIGIIFSLLGMTGLLISLTIEKRKGHIPRRPHDLFA